LPPRHRRRADAERSSGAPATSSPGRSLDFYDAVARRLAGQAGAR
jgi:hypothetical protein